MKNHPWNKDWRAYVKKNNNIDVIDTDEEDFNEDY